MNYKHVAQVLAPTPMNLSALLVLIFVHTGVLWAQAPFSNTTVGRPGANDVNRSGGNATVLYANSDASNDANEFLYFKVYSPGGGSNWANYDWYSNPTAWLDPYNFHFNNVNLKMYKNAIRFNAGGVLEFGSDQVKEVNAGKIGYSLFKPGLNIIGGNSPNSTLQSDRRVFIYSEGGTTIAGKLIIADSDADKPIPQKLANGADLSTYKLFVNGGVLAREVRVNTSWADYVFTPAYRLKPLEEVDRQIRQLGHLPGMPAAKEIELDGLNVGQMARLQQEKIEELTLYIIGLKKEIDQLRQSLTATK